MELTDLQETADLARLNISRKDLENIFPAFEQMASFFTIMQAADAEEALPAVKGQIDGMAASTMIAGADYLRADSAGGGEQDSEYLLSQAPQRDGRFMVIPNVL